VLFYEWIVDRQEFYPCLDENDILTLDRLKGTFSARHQEIQKIAAFTEK
jgi:hypothetical protein